MLEPACMYNLFPSDAVKAAYGPHQTLREHVAERKRPFQTVRALTVNPPL